MSIVLHLVKYTSMVSLCLSENVLRRCCSKFDARSFPNSKMDR